jgi:hypothetical protein
MPVTPIRVTSAQKAALRAIRTGKLLYLYSQIFFVLTTIGLAVALVLGYRLGEDTYKTWEGGQRVEKVDLDWQLILSNWGVMVAAWLVAVLFIVLLAAIGAIAQSKGESVEIQIEEATP